MCLETTVDETLKSLDVDVVLIKGALTQILPTMIGKFKNMQPSIRELLENCHNR